MNIFSSEFKPIPKLSFSVSHGSPTYGVIVGCQISDTGKEPHHEEPVRHSSHLSK